MDITDFSRPVDGLPATSGPATSGPATSGPATPVGAPGTGEPAHRAGQARARWPGETAHGEPAFRAWPGAPAAVIYETFRRFN